MAILHVWSAAGAPSAPYGSWAAAAANLSTAAAAAAAGDTIYVAHDHAETAAGQTITYTGTLAAPTKVICGTRTGTGAETGISALATTANIKSSTTTFVTAGGVAYVYGVEFELAASSATVFYICQGTASSMTYEDCKFHVVTGTTSSLRTGGNAAATTHPHCILKNCILKFSATGQWIEADSTTEFLGGSIAAGSTTPTTLCRMGQGNRGGLLLMSGFDFTNFSTGFDVFGPGNTTQRGTLRNCKFPSGWSGEIHTAAPTAGGTRWEMINYGAGDTNYKFWTSDTQGQCKDDNAIYRDSGASDGVTPYSIRMISNANCAYPGHALQSPPIIKRIDTLAGATAVNIDILHDGASALTDAEVWVEYETLGTSNFPLSTFVTDRVGITGSPAAQASSSNTWAGDSGTGPNGSATWNRLTLAALPTVNEVGYLIATVYLAKASTTIFVDPMIVVT